MPMNPKHDEALSECECDPPLVIHLETHLGRSAGGWSFKRDERRTYVQAVRFEGAPIARARTAVTLGMSNQVIAQHDGSEGRQELVFCAYKEGFPDDAAAVLVLVASDVLKRGVALRQGDVLGPAGPLFDDPA